MTRAPDSKAPSLDASDAKGSVALEDVDVSDNEVFIRCGQRNCGKPGEWSIFFCEEHDPQKAAPEDIAKGLVFLLTRIGSWTSARWDQHLRHEYGDEVADKIIEWVEAKVDNGVRGATNMPPRSW